MYCFVFFRNKVIPRTFWSYYIRCMKGINWTVHMEESRGHLACEANMCTSLFCMISFILHHQINRHAYVSHGRRQPISWLGERLSASQNALSSKRVSYITAPHDVRTLELNASHLFFSPSRSSSICLYLWSFFCFFFFWYSRCLDITCFL